MKDTLKSKMITEPSPEDKCPKNKLITHTTTLPLIINNHSKVESNNDLS